MKRKLWISLLLAVVMTLLAAVALADGSTYTFITTTDSEPATLNQVKGWTGDYFNNTYLLQSPLFRYHNGTIVNELCTEYTVSDDGLVYTFTLRDAQYNDGVAVTAADCVYMLKCYLDPANGASAATFYSSQNIVNAAAFASGEITDFDEVGAKALDDHTFQITLDAPNSRLVFYMAYYMYCPLRQDVFEAYGDAMGSSPDKMVYSGPYVLTDWTSGTSISMEKNPLYWNAENSFPTETIVHLLVGDSNTTYSLYENGDADVVLSLDAEYVSLIPESELSNAPANYMPMFWCNPQGTDEEAGKLMSNLNFRKALNYALNRELIVNAITPLYTANVRMFSPYHTVDGVNMFDTYQPDTVPTTGDFEKAQAYLAAAMEELGYTSVDQLPTIHLVTYENSNYKLYAETVIDQWNQVLGINNVQFDQYAVGTALGMIYSAEFDIFLIGNDMGPTPDELMAMFLPGNEYDFGGCWESPEYEEFVTAMKAAQALEGQEGYADALAVAEQKFLDASIILPIYRSSEVAAVKSYVSGYEATILGRGYLLDNLVVSK